MNSLQAFYYKYRIRLVTILTVILGLFSLYAIYWVLEVKVTSNDECLWVTKKIEKDSVAIFFDKVKVDGVTYQAGVRDGDILLEIDGHRITDALVAQNILDKFNSGEYADYKFQKPDGKIVESKVQVKKLIEFGSLAQAISALIYLLIGFMVFTSKPDGLAHRLFFLIGILAALALVRVFFPRLDVLSFINEYRVLSFLMFAILTIAFSFIPFVILYFFMIFPKPFPLAKNKYFKIAMVAIPVVLTLFGFVSVLLDLTVLKNWPFTVFKISYFDKLGTVSAVGGIIAWVLLIVHFIREKDKLKRKPITVLLIALTLSIVVSFYVSTIAPAISDTIFNSPEYYMPVILLVLVPILFGYAILKYHLLDVTVVVRNAITYGAATLTVAAIYFVVIYVLGQGISRAVGAENQGIIAGIFFIVFALVFQSTKDRFQNVLTKRFYPEQFAYQTILVKFSNEVSTVVGQEKILDLIEKTFVDELMLDKFGLLLLNNKTNNFQLVRSTGFSNNKCEIENPNIYQFVQEKYLITKYPIIERQDFSLIFLDKVDKLIQEEVYTVVPMIVKSKVIGLLLFGLKHSGSQFSGKELELLTAASSQAAISLENARLYQTESEKLKLERDLELARQIQQSLLPGCIPFMSGLDICGEMIPAMQVGGDYFDLIRVSGNKLFVAVGDVSGKGLSASFYMTKVQTMIQLACDNNASPKEILVEVNKRMYESIERNWFVTMTLALFDTEAKTVKFCRAGHLPVYKAINGSVDSLKTQGIGLGLERGVIFEQTLVEEKMPLSKGEVYAFFSDGITEAMNEKNELFGEDKLKNLLLNRSDKRSSDIMNEVWQSIQSFRGATEVNDDMTMVIVKVD